MRMYQTLCFRELGSHGIELPSQGDRVEHSGMMLRTLVILFGVVLRDSITGINGGMRPMKRIEKCIWGVRVIWVRWVRYI